MIKVLFQFLDFTTRDKFIAEFTIAGVRIGQNNRNDEFAKELCIAVEEQRYKEFIPNLETDNLWRTIPILCNVYDIVFSRIYMRLVNVNVRLGLSYLFLSNESLGPILERVNGTDGLCLLEKYAFGWYSFHYNRSHFDKRLHELTLFYMEIRERMKLAIRTWMKLVYTKKVSVSKDVGNLIGIFVRKSVWDDVEVWVQKRENKRVKV